MKKKGGGGGKEGERDTGSDGERGRGRARGLVTPCGLRLPEPEWAPVVQGEVD